MSYYVEPEYWIEGYAVGDAKSAAANIAITSALSVSVFIFLGSSSYCGHKRGYCVCFKDCNRGINNASKCNSFRLSSVIA